MTRERLRHHRISRDHEILDQILSPCLLANDNIMHALIAVDIPERTPGPDMGASAARGEEEPGNAPDDQGLRRLYA